MPSSTYKKMAIYDPEMNLFMSKDSGDAITVHEIPWTGDTTRARTFVVSMTDYAIGLLKSVRYDRPSAIFVEMTITCSYEPVALPEIKPREYYRNLETYNKLLPIFLKDRDDFIEKDWRAFKDARQFLLQFGDLVVSLK